MLLNRIKFTNQVPKDLLAERSVVIYPATMSEKELTEIQRYFQQTGIDAVNYIDITYLLAGFDISKRYSIYFNSRKIKYLILVQKTERNFQFNILEYNNTAEFSDPSKEAWKVSGITLAETLQVTYRACIASQRKQNLLINDLPEKIQSLSYFNGKQIEGFSSYARSFKIAIPKCNCSLDQELDTLLKEFSPLTYELVESGTTDTQLDQAGFRCVLRFVHSRGAVVKELLGYDISQLAKSIPSVSYLQGQSQIKTILSNALVYKFYIKNIDYGDIYLGNKYDADIEFRDALRNYLLAMKYDFRMN